MAGDAVTTVPQLTLPPPRPLTPEELLVNAQHASEELIRAREEMRRLKTPDAAITFCKAYQAAKLARARLPKPRLVG